MQTCDCQDEYHVPRHSLIGHQLRGRCFNLPTFNAEPDGGINLLLHLHEDTQPPRIRVVVKSLRQDCDQSWEAPADNLVTLDSTCGLKYATYLKVDGDINHLKEGTYQVHVLVADTPKVLTLNVPGLPWNRPRAGCLLG